MATFVKLNEDTDMFVTYVTNVDEDLYLAYDAVVTECGSSPVWFDGETWQGVDDAARELRDMFDHLTPDMVGKGWERENVDYGDVVRHALQDANVNAGRQSWAGLFDAPTLRFDMSFTFDGDSFDVASVLTALDKVRASICDAHSANAGAVGVVWDVNGNRVGNWSIVDVDDSQGE